MIESTLLSPTGGRASAGRLGVLSVEGLATVGLGEVWYPPDGDVGPTEDSFIHQIIPTKQAIPTNHFVVDEVEAGLPGLELAGELPSSDGRPGSGFRLLGVLTPGAGTDCFFLAVGDSSAFWFTSETKELRPENPLVPGFSSSLFSFKSLLLRKIQFFAFAHHPHVHGPVLSSKLV